MPDRANNLYMTALTKNGIMKRDAKTGAITMLVEHHDFPWPDTMAWGPGGSPSLVSSHLHLWVDGDMDFDSTKVSNFRICRLKTGANPYHAP